MSPQKVLLSTFLFIFLAMAASGAAHAGTGDTAITRVSYPGTTFTGKTKAWGSKVEITQPQTLVPIFVTFSTDYKSNAPMIIGLKVNNGPCAVYGPAFLQKTQADLEYYANATFNWVIMPGDYSVVKGTNTIQLCGGGFNETDSVELGYYTLTVRLEK